MLARVAHHSPVTTARIYFLGPRHIVRKKSGFLYEYERSVDPNSKFSVRDFVFFQSEWY
jgi:hypothetical protein